MHASRRLGPVCAALLAVLVVTGIGSAGSLDSRTRWPGTVQTASGV